MKLGKSLGRHQANDEREVAAGLICGHSDMTDGLDQRAAFVMSYTKSFNIVNGR